MSSYPVDSRSQPSWSNMSRQSYQFASVGVPGAVVGDQDTDGTLQQPQRALTRQLSADSATQLLNTTDSANENHIRDVHLTSVIASLSMLNMHENANSCFSNDSLPADITQLLSQIHASPNHTQFVSKPSTENNSPVMQERTYRKSVQPEVTYSTQSFGGVWADGATDHAKQQKLFSAPTRELDALTFLNSNQVITVQSSTGGAGDLRRSVYSTPCLQQFSDEATVYGSRPQYQQQHSYPAPYGLLQPADINEYLREEMLNALITGGRAGELAQRSPPLLHAQQYSRKVFIGGLPPDIDEIEIAESFRQFGSLSVDWPHKAESTTFFPPKGYCFLLFQTEASVHRLVESCYRDDDKLFWHVTSTNVKDKAVQIRPWSVADAEYIVDPSFPVDLRKTIFVGGVPRPLRAIELALMMDQLFGGVCSVGIDTDPELRYPKGAARVTFNNQQSYIAAISAHFVQLQHADTNKRVEVKPYVLDDQLCDECQGNFNGGRFAPYFCASVTCLQYYCEVCWDLIHSRPGRQSHKPLIKEGADRARAMPSRFH